MGVHISLGSTLSSPSPSPSCQRCTVKSNRDRTISVELASTITRSTAIPCIEIESFMDIILESWEKFYSHAYNAIKSKFFCIFLLPPPPKKKLMVPWRLNCKKKK